MIRKLECYGITGSLIRWFESYLSDRVQLVKIKNFISKEILVCSGVGQGTHLGPLLFIIFINDISYVFKNCSFILFADDLKIYKKITSFVDRINLQSDLNLFYEWFCDNGLYLNLVKCYFIIFGKNKIQPLMYSISDMGLEKVSVVKDLGIYFDENLNFETHIEYIILKAKKKLNFLKRYTKNFVQKDSFRTLYYSYYYPFLMFGSEIWSPINKNLIYNIEKLNHLFLRYASYRIGFSMCLIDHDY